MGWISERHMKRGGSLYSGGPKRKGPLKKVVTVIYASNGMFGLETAGLECGHITHNSWGGHRAVCPKCFKGLPIDFDPKDPSSARKSLLEKYRSPTEKKVV